MSFLFAEYLLYKKIKEKRQNLSFLDQTLDSMVGRKEDIDAFNKMICRVCTNDADISLNNEIDDIKIISAIRNVANISINFEDYYPKYICRQCLEDLKIALAFKRKCESADMRFRQSIPSLTSYDIPVEQHDFQLLLHQMQQNRLRRIEIRNKRKLAASEARKKKLDNIRRNIRTKRYRCVPCDLSFFSKESLLEHRALRSCMRHPCPTCGNLVKNVDLHVRLIHQRKERYSCHVCGKVSSTVAGLRSHMFVHSDRFDYSCPICPYKGKQRAYLAIHMRRHTGERPYLCTKCPATFSNASNMRKHQLIHSIKAFECSKCKKCFHSKKTLDEHFEAAHLHFRYQCNICGRELWSRAKLLRHELRMHNREKHKTNKSIAKVVASEKIQEDNKSSTASNKIQEENKVNIIFAEDFFSDSKNIYATVLDEQIHVDLPKLD